MDPTQVIYLVARSLTQMFEYHGSEFEFHMARMLIVQTEYKRDGLEVIDDEVHAALTSVTDNPEHN